MFYSVALPRRREKVVSISWSEWFPKNEPAEEVVVGKKSLTDLWGQSGLVLAAAPTIVNLQSTGDHQTLTQINHNVTHAFDPLITVIQGLSHPIAFLMISAGCICVIMNQKHKGLNIIKWAAAGYILIQFVPGIMNILEGVGAAIDKG